MKISIFLNAICFFALVTCENYYFTELGEFKVPLKHENLTIDSRINMTDIETNVQVSYSALSVLGKGCKKHRIDCNDTIFELTVNLEEIENRLDNIFSLVDSNRVRPKKIAHPTLNEEWLNALEGHHEKCGDILANEFTKVENNILTDYSRAGEITAAILDMKQNILHPLLFSPLNTVKEMKLSSYKDQFLYKPVNLFNYNKIIKFVTFSMLPSPKDSTIFLKMDIPVFEPVSEKMSLHKMNVPLKGEEFGYMVTRSEADNLKYFFKKDILDCAVVQEPREVLYICQEKEEFLNSGADDFDCISEALNENSLNLLCRLQYNFRERFFVCVIVGVLMVLSLVVMAVIMVVIRRRNREQRYEYLLKY